MNVEKMVMLAMIFISSVYSAIVTLLACDKNKEIMELREENKIYADYINEYVPESFIEEYNEDVEDVEDAEDAEDAEGTNDI